MMAWRGAAFLAAAPAVLAWCPAQFTRNSTCVANAGGRIATTTAADATACCSACTANAVCAAWSFWGVGSCSLFNSSGEHTAGDCTSGRSSEHVPTQVPPPGPPCTDCPNIIFSLTDDQDLILGGWDPMAQTHARLQAKGTTLSRFMIHTPMCSPSRSETVSGRYFHNIKSAYPVPPQILLPAATAHIDGELYKNQSFGVYLRAHKGYQVGIFGKANFNTNEGFDRWFEGASLGYAGSWQDNELPGAGYKYKAGADEYATALLGNKSVEWLRRGSVTGAESEGRPFFLYFAPHCPHIPATPAKWYADACPGVAAPRVPNFNYSGPAPGSAGAFHELVSGQAPFRDEEVRLIDALARLRCQCLLSVDDAHAALDDAVAALGLEGRTYWFVSSDHGYNLGNHRLPSNKFLLYDHSLRIPMVVKGPGVAAGAALPVLATNVDWAPTWLGLAGIDTPACMDGRSLAPMLVTNVPQALPATRRHLLGGARARAAPAERTEQFVQYYNQGPWRPDDEKDGLNRTLDDYSNTYIGLHVVDPALGSGHYKYGEYEYVCNSSRIEAKACFSDIDMYELFDLVADPYELSNIYDAAPDALKGELHRRLRRYYPCRGAACP